MYQFNLRVNGVKGCVVDVQFNQHTASDVIKYTWSPADIATIKQQNDTIKQQSDREEIALLKNNNVENYKLKMKIL